MLADVELSRIVTFEEVDGIIEFGNHGETS